MPEFLAIHQPLVRERPVLATFPHSGVMAPDAVLENWTLRHRQTLRNTDWHLPELYSFLPEMGVTSIQNLASRYVIDPNRELRSPLLGNYRNFPIYESDTWGEPLYIAPPSIEEQERRVGEFYQPFHDAVRCGLENLLEKFHRVFLWDFHSFMGLVEADIVLGNASGRTCSPKTLQLMRACLEDEGFSVVENKIYTGGHIVKRYAERAGVEALQIEIHYGVYLPVTELDRPRPPVPESLQMARVRDRLSRALERAVTELEVGAIRRSLA